MAAGTVGQRVFRKCLLAFALISLLICLKPLTADARRIVRVLDFDGTLVDDQSDTSTWRTYWILERIDQLHSMIQGIPSEEGAPPFVQISYKEYLRHITALGGGGLFNALSAVPLDEDPIFRGRPRTFVPGWYQVSDPFTFKYYRPSPRGKNYMLRDYEHARNRTQIMNDRQNDPTKKVYGWKGPAFALFAAGAASASTVGDIVISSARWAQDREYQELFDAMVRDQEIKFSRGTSATGRPTVIRSYKLRSPRARLLSVDPQEMSQLKARVIQDEATAILHGARSDSDDPALPDILIAAEEEPRYVEAIVRKLEELSATGHFATDIKFMFLNAGPEQFLAHARYPFRYAVFERGRGRRARPEEIALVETPLAEQSSARPADNSLRPLCGNFVSALLEGVVP